MGSGLDATLAPINGGGVLGSLARENDEFLNKVGPTDLTQSGRIPVTTP